MQAHMQATQATKTSESVCNQNLYHLLPSMATIHLLATVKPVPLHTRHFTPAGTQSSSLLSSSSCLFRNWARGRDLSLISQKRRKGPCREALTGRARTLEWWELPPDPALEQGHDDVARRGSESKDLGPLSRASSLPPWVPASSASSSSSASVFSVRKKAAAPRKAPLQTAPDGAASEGSPAPHWLKEGRSQNASDERSLGRYDAPWEPSGESRWADEGDEVWGKGELRRERRGPELRTRAGAAGAAATQSQSPPSTSYSTSPRPSRAPWQRDHSPSSTSSAPAPPRSQGARSAPSESSYPARFSKYSQKPSRLPAGYQPHLAAAMAAPPRQILSTEGGTPWTEYGDHDDADADAALSAAGDKPGATTQDFHDGRGGLSADVHAQGDTPRRVYRRIDDGDGGGGEGEEESERRAEGERWEGEQRGTRGGERGEGRREGAGPGAGSGGGGARGVSGSGSGSGSGRAQKQKKQQQQPLPLPEGDPEIPAVEFPFEFMYSYSETPKVAPIGFREPPMSPFGPSTMSRPWTGGAPMQKSKKNRLPRILPEFDNFAELPPAGRRHGPKPVQPPGPYAADEGPKYVRTREEIMGEPLTRQEVQEMIDDCSRTNRQVNLGRDGLTHNMLTLVHSHWKRSRLAKIKCKGVPTVDMDNVCSAVEVRSPPPLRRRDGLTHNMLTLVHSHWKRSRLAKIKCKGVPTVDMDNVCSAVEEVGEVPAVVMAVLVVVVMVAAVVVVQEKTGGAIVRRAGGVLHVFRGRNYNYRLRPQLPLMLWKPPSPVYPRLIQDAPPGLTKDEANDFRKRGRRLKPICKLGKNGVYLTLVRDVRAAFRFSELVKVDCKGLDKSDYKKIGAKLQELVPCVLLSFEKEQILMWRGPAKTAAVDGNAPEATQEPPAADAGATGEAGAVGAAAERDGSLSETADNSDGHAAAAAPEAAESDSRMQVSEGSGLITFADDEEDAISPRGTPSTHHLEAYMEGEVEFKEEQWYTFEGGEGSETEGEREAKKGEGKDVATPAATAAATGEGPALDQEEAGSAPVARDKVLTGKERKRIDEFEVLWNVALKTGQAQPVDGVESESDAESAEV
eukprot:jgi/Mesen1/10487/ME000083S09998